MASHSSASAVINQRFMDGNPLTSEINLSLIDCTMLLLTFPKETKKTLKKSDG
jgi:hypothetical protein